MPAHAHVRKHQVERVALQAIERFLARNGGGDQVATRPEQARDGFRQRGLVVYGQAAQLPLRDRRLRRRIMRRHLNPGGQLRGGKAQPESRPFANRGLYAHLSTVARHDPEHRREPQARARVTLGREERLEDLALDLG
jgi:hypothetical protein